MSWSSLIPAALALVNISLSEPAPTSIDEALDLINSLPQVEQLIPQEVQTILDEITSRDGDSRPASQTSGASDSPSVSKLTSTSSESASDRVSQPETESQPMTRSKSTSRQPGPAVTKSGGIGNSVSKSARSGVRGPALAAQVRTLRGAR